jgi:hypothetical protein
MNRSSLLQDNLRGVGSDMRTAAMV